MASMLLSIALGVAKIQRFCLLVEGDSYLALYHHYLLKFLHKISSLGSVAWHSIAHNSGCKGLIFISLPIGQTYQDITFIRSLQTECGRVAAIRIASNHLDNPISIIRSNISFILMGSSKRKQLYRSCPHNHHLHLPPPSPNPTPPPSAPQHTNKRHRKR